MARVKRHRMRRMTREVVEGKRSINSARLAMGLLPLAALRQGIVSIGEAPPRGSRW
jgi:hypothetical protein